SIRFARSAHGYCYAVHRIVQVAFRIPDDRVWLADALIVRGAGPDLVVARLRQAHLRAPLLPRKGIDRLVQFRLLPRLAEVVGDGELDHLMRAAPSVSTHLDFAAVLLAPRYRRRDQGFHRH